MVGFSLSVTAQTNVPDPNFRYVLSSNGVTFDGSGNITNQIFAEGITTLNANWSSISSFSGIEALTGLETFYCTYNSLTTLDLSSNLALINLDCSNNQLTTLNLSANINLEVLICAINNLSSLDLSANTKLKTLTGYSNQVGSLDLSSNLALTQVAIWSNLLTTLTLPSSSSILTLQCNDNLLTALDVSGNPTMIYLACDSNQIATLDLSANSALNYLYCAKNQLSELDISGNSALFGLNIFKNPTPFTLYVRELPFPTSGVTSFTDTNPASGKLLGILPVELTSFTGKIFHDLVTLNWSTASEKNNAGWEIQRQENRSQKSEDRINAEWETIGFVSGKGTTTEAQSYSFSSPVPRPLSPAVYRLKQLDLDGTTSYSKILTIENNPTEFSLQQNYPNPFNPETKISYSVAKTGPVLIAVYDALGRKVETLVDKQQKVGTYTAEFNGVGKSSGIYFIRMEADGFGATKKMVMVK